MVEQARFFRSRPGRPASPQREVRSYIIDVLDLRLSSENGKVGDFGVFFPCFSASPFSKPRGKLATYTDPMPRSDPQYPLVYDALRAVSHCPTCTMHGPMGTNMAGSTHPRLSGQISARPLGDHLDRPARCRYFSGNIFACPCPRGLLNFCCSAAIQAPNPTPYSTFVQDNLQGSRMQPLETPRILK